MRFKKFTFVSRTEPEVLVAFIDEEGFDSFQLENNSVTAYISEEKVTPGFIPQLLEKHGHFIAGYVLEDLPDTNWNALWESNFDPVVLPGFCAVRADFHDPVSDVHHEIIINPRMAFGTGHHETTYMMMQAMQALSWSDVQVLDFGCGTGVLAILAEKLGAEQIFAIDNDQEAVNNTLQNISKNGCEKINTKLGSIEDVQGKFDLVLANINRNVLLSAMRTIKEILNQKGILLLSGILIKDIPQIESVASENGLEKMNEMNKGEWSCLQFVKNP